MAYLIETLITHFFQVFIFKRFDWNEKKYNEIIHFKNVFVFRYKSKFFIFLKLFLFFLLFLCIFIFLFIYFYELYHNAEQVPVKIEHHFFSHKSTEDINSFSQPDYEELGRGSWVFLLFAIFFLLDWQNEAKLLFSKKKSRIQRQNIYHSCYMPYYIVLIFICSIRLILLFTIDDGTVVMDYPRVLQILNNFPQEHLSFVLFISYIILIITSISMIVISILILVFHPHLKEEFFVQCIKMNKHWARILKMPYYESWFHIKKRKSIHDKIKNFYNSYFKNSKENNYEEEIENIQDNSEETNYKLDLSQQRIAESLKKNAQKYNLNENRLKIKSKEKYSTYNQRPLIPLTESLYCPLYYDDVNLGVDIKHKKNNNLNKIVHYYQRNKHKAKY